MKLLTSKHLKKTPNFVAKEPIYFIFQLLGFMPLQLNSSTGEFQFRWNTFSVIHSVLTSLFLAALLITILFGAFFYCEYPNENLDQEALDYLAVRRSMKGLPLLLGGIVVGNIITAMISLISFIWNSARIATQVNTFRKFCLNNSFKYSISIRKISRQQTAFLTMFGAAQIICGITDSSIVSIQRNS